MEESEVNVLPNHQYEEGIKEQIEDIADGFNQSSDFIGTTVYAWNVVENDVFVHLLIKKWLIKQMNVKAR